MASGTRIEITARPAFGAAPRQAFAGRALRAAAAFWLCCAIGGQLLFASYVAGFYGRAAIHGHPELWNKVLPYGYVPGETFLNLVLAVHLAFAVAIVLGGTWQLIPGLRRRAPAVHRWNGRAYVLFTGIASLAGLAMMWLHGAVGDLSQHLAISSNALVTIACGFIAWREGRMRRYAQHRRWALRLFLAASGVWFFRVGLMLWLLINQGPAGFDPDRFTGPFLTFLAWAQYLLPLAVLELYFRAQQHGTPRGQLAMAAGLALLTLAMLAGIGGAATVMWLPRLLA